MRTGVKRPHTCESAESCHSLRTVRKSTAELLAAEMKLPGEATLEFRIEEIAPGQTLLKQSAHFLPRGITGLLYWYAITPFHNFIFNGMLRGIGAAISRPVIRGPERMADR